MLAEPKTRKEIRDALWNPANGRQSSELEITSISSFRRKRDEETRLQRENDRLQAELSHAAATAEATRIAIATAAAEAKRMSLEALLAAGYSPPRPTVAKILAEVCRRYKVSEIDVRSKRRTANIVMPRHIVMYLSKKLTELSLPQIGARLGGRDHTTVLSAVNKITALVENHPHLCAEVADISKSLTEAE